MRIFPNIEKLQNEGTYSIRTFRMTKYDKTLPKFKPERLFIMRDPKGHVCLVTTKDRDWAEFDPRGYDYQEENGIGIFTAEDYVLEIELSSIAE